MRYDLKIRPVGSHHGTVNPARFAKNSGERNGNTEKIIAAIAKLGLAVSPQIQRATGLHFNSVNHQLTRLYREGRLVRKGQIIGAMGRPMHIYAVAESAQKAAP